MLIPYFQNKQATKLEFGNISLHCHALKYMPPNTAIESIINNPMFFMFNPK